MPVTPTGTPILISALATSVANLITALSYAGVNIGTANATATDTGATDTFNNAIAGRVKKIGDAVTGLLTLSGAGTGLAVTNNATVGGTLAVTGAATLAQTTSNVITSTVATSPILFKNGPAGPILLQVGGSAGAISANTNIALPGGAWGSGALVNNTAPLFQNTTFTGSTTSQTAAFGAFLQQTDNSSVTPGAFGLFEHLALNGSGVVGARSAGMFILDILQTGNTTFKDYVALEAKCNLNTTDGGAGGNYSVAFGINPVASIGPGVTAGGCVGAEINTWVQAGAVVTDRIGLQVVDCAGTTFGVQAVRDDVALSLNNQYAPSATLGFKIGLGFGRVGGGFPVSTTGTLIYGQAPSGGSWTVANGIDWHLGTFTGNSWNDGKTTIDGSGNITGVTFKVGANQVVGARDTGWTAMTGTPDKATAYATSSVTLAQLAGRVAELQAILTAHGLIGA